MTNDQVLDALCKAIDKTTNNKFVLVLLSEKNVVTDIKTNIYFYPDNTLIKDILVSAADKVDTI